MRTPLGTVDAAVCAPDESGGSHAVVETTRASKRLRERVMGYD
jgi:hypothetical protein